MLISMNYLMTESNSSILITSAARSRSHCHVPIFSRYIRPPSLPRPYHLALLTTQSREKLATSRPWGEEMHVDLRLLLSRAASNSGAAERGLERTSAAYPPSFYMHHKDPHAHWEMI